jgi:hypothetical protein
MAVFMFPKDTLNQSLITVRSEQEKDIFMKVDCGYH